MTKQYRKEFLLSFRRIRHLTRSTLPHLRALSASPRRSVVRWRWWSTSSSLSSSPPLFDIKMRIMFKETFCRRASAFFNGFSPHRMGVIRMQSSTDGGLAKDKYNSSWYVVLAAHFVPIAITRQFAFVFYSVLWPPQIAHWSHRTQTHTLSKCIEAKSTIFFFFHSAKFTVIQTQYIRFHLCCFASNLPRYCRRNPRRNPFPIISESQSFSTSCKAFFFSRHHPKYQFSSIPNIRHQFINFKWNCRQQIYIPIWTKTTQTRN